MTLALGLMGSVAASWKDGISINQTVVTGDIDPRFTSCRVLGETCWPGRADAYLRDNGKRLSVEVEDAYPGYLLLVKYRVSNQVSIPVKYYTQTGHDSWAVLVCNLLPEGVLEGNGGSREGLLSLLVLDVEEQTRYEFEE